MARLSKKEKDLLLFMYGSSIGTISVRDDSSDHNIIKKLYGRSLVKYHPPLLPFLTYGVTYWSLSEIGWEKCKALTKPPKTSKKIR